MKKTARTRQSKAVRETDILSAAELIFSEKGYAKASISEIAKHAGVVEGTIYKYFSSKQDLLVNVIARFYKNAIEKTEDSLSGITGIENQLRVFILRHMEIFADNVGLCRLVLEEIRPLDEYQQSEAHQYARRYSNSLLSLLESAVDNGEVRNDISTKVMRDMIFGSLEHIAWNFFLKKKVSFDAEKIMTDVSAIALGGILVSTKSTSSAMANEIQKKRFDINLDRLEKIIDRLEPSVSRH